MPKKLIVINGVGASSGSNALFESKENKIIQGNGFTPIKFTKEDKIEEFTTIKKRGRKPKNVMYFTSETEDAIVAYAKEKSESVRNTLYNQKIKYSFDKLAENIINTFSFSYITESYRDIKTEVVSHMLLNCNKYDKTKGKAFSYFSIVAKNYLIIANNQYYVKVKSNYSIQSNDKSSDFEFDILDESHAKGISNQETSEFIKILIKYWELNIPFIFKKKRDNDIAASIVELLKNVSSLEFFNKKALYLLIREMTGHKTQYITRVVNKMRSHYAKVQSTYYTTGNLEEKDFFVRKN